MVRTFIFAWVLMSLFSICSPKHLVSVMLVIPTQITFGPITYDLHAPQTAICFQSFFFSLYNYWISKTTKYNDLTWLSVPINWLEESFSTSILQQLNFKLSSDRLGFMFTSRQERDNICVLTLSVGTLLLRHCWVISPEPSALVYKWLN